MSAAKTQDAMGRVRSATPTLSEAMLRISQIVQDDPQALLQTTITELAERAKTSPATVTRFCRQMGYTGYVPFRLALAESVGRDDSSEAWDSAIGRNFGPDETPEEILRSILDAQSRTLLLTAASLDLDQMGRIAAAVAECQTFNIYGAGGSAIIGHELQARLFRIGINAQSYSEAHTSLVSAALLNDRCVAFGISNSGSTQETLDALTLAKENGAYTIAVTGRINSPLARIADECVLTLVPDPYIKPDNIGPRLAQLFLMDLFYLLIAQQNFPRTTRNLSITADAMKLRKSAKKTRAEQPEAGRPKSDDGK